MHRGLFYKASPSLGKPIVTVMVIFLCHILKGGMFLEKREPYHISVDTFDFNDF